MKPTPEQLAKLPKWARSYVTELEDKANGMAALVYPTEPKPERMKWPEGRSWNDLEVGWWINSHSTKIGKGCFNGGSHSIRSTIKTDRQRPGEFYTTKEEALLALRWEVIERFQKEMAEAIRDIERQS
jgi:hypothetical protein